MYGQGFRAEGFGLRVLAAFSGLAGRLTGRYGDFQKPRVFLWGLQ